MGSKKGRNPEKKERKRRAKEQQEAASQGQPDVDSGAALVMGDVDKAGKLFNEGNEHYKNARYDLAIECFTEAIELKPNYVEAYTYRGVTCAGRGEYTKAIKDYNEALKINPNYSVAYKNRCLAYYEKGEYDKAIEDYTKAIEINPNDAVAHYSRGLVYDKKDDFIQAIKDYTEAIRLNPNYDDAYNNRGVVNSKKGEYELAIQDYDEAIKLNPDLPDSYINRGNAYTDKKEYCLAIKDYDKAIRLKPDYADAYYSRGNTYYEREDYTKAIQDYDEAIRFNPDLSEAYSNRGLAYKNKGEYDLAIKDYDEAIEISPNDANSYHNKGIALVTLAGNDENKKKYKEWTTKANAHYIKWVEICIKNNIVDYSTSMFIYQLRHLLLKEKNKVSTTEIDELTTEYINKIVKSERDNNKEETEKYFPNKNKIILYQYCPYNKNAIYKIKQEQMYFSDPLTFNDPFDPLIRVLSKEHSKGLMELLNFRVSCLSPKEDNLLLWSHYADKHQGICVAYDITELVKQDNIIFRKIEHIATFQKPQEGLMFGSLNTVNELSKSETLINTFTKKQNVWSYEEEYRLILQTDKEEEFLQKADIKEIYLGRDMPKEDKEFIKDMIKERNLKKTEDIKVYSMDVSDEDIFQLKHTPEN